MLWTAKQLKDWDVSTRSMKHDGWVPMRGLTRKPGLISRIKTAWRVFTSKYDAVNWEEENYLEETYLQVDTDRINHLHNNPNKCPVNAQTKENFPIGPCDKATPGWYCSRKKGHDGPCAAHKVPQPQ